MSSSDDIQKRLAKNGWGSVLRPVDEHVQHVPCGILTLDIALLGGPVLGQLNHTIGYESAGKSTLAFIKIAAFQRAFPTKKAVYIDVEQTLDTTYAEVYGVDLDRLIIARPETGEQAVDLAHEYLKADDVCIVVFDSVPALFSEKLLAKEAGDPSIPGIQARLMSNLISKAANALGHAKNRGLNVPGFEVINFWRSKIVMMGDDRSIPGGNHLRQAMFNNVNLKNQEKHGQDPVLKDVVALYNEHSFEIRKNKIGNSLKQGGFTITRTSSHRKGVGWIDQGETWWKYGRSAGLITGGGGKFKIDGFGLEGKKAEIVTWLEDNPDMTEALCHEILCRYRVKYGKSRDGWRAGEYISIDWPEGVVDGDIDTDDE